MTDSDRINAALEQLCKDVAALSKKMDVQYNAAKSKREEMGDNIFELVGPYTGRNDRDG